MEHLQQQQRGKASAAKFATATVAAESSNAQLETGTQAATAAPALTTLKLRVSLGLTSSLLMDQAEPTTVIFRPFQAHVQLLPLLSCLHQTVYLVTALAF